MNTITWNIYCINKANTNQILIASLEQIIREIIKPLKTLTSSSEWAAHNKHLNQWLHEVQTNDNTQVIYPLNMHQKNSKNPNEIVFNANNRKSAS